ncbi:hypothetical protein ZWY2020_042625, partial [Hordeum vulgare]
MLVLETRIVMHVHFHLMHHVLVASSGAVVHWMLFLCWVAPRSENEYDFILLNPVGREGVKGKSGGFPLGPRCHERVGQKMSCKFFPISTYDYIWNTCLHYIDELELHLRFSRDSSIVRIFGSVQLWNPRAECLSKFLNPLVIFLKHCLILLCILPGNGARNPSCYLLSLRWFSLEEERVMQQS